LAPDRHIDTAAAYGNERQVGETVHSSDLDRSEVFLETKVWITDYGYDETLHAFEKSAGKLGVDQIDLLILRQPLPSAFDRTLEAYRALETLLADGKVRAIGVSNFMVEHLTTLLAPHDAPRRRDGIARGQPDRVPPLLRVAWIYLLALVIVFAVEVNVVSQRRLWPRGLLTPFTDSVRLTSADERAYTGYAESERHKGFEVVDVGFEPREEDESGESGRG
jgi:hypothetical protein